MSAPFPWSRRNERGEEEYALSCVVAWLVNAYFNPTECAAGRLRGHALAAHQRAVAMGDFLNHLAREARENYADGVPAELWFVAVQVPLELRADAIKTWREWVALVPAWGGRNERGEESFTLACVAFWACRYLEPGVTSLPGQAMSDRACDLLDDVNRLFTIGGGMPAGERYFAECKARGWWRPAPRADPPSPPAA